MAADAPDLSSVSPAEFAQLIADAKDKDLAAGMASEARGDILGEVFRRMEEHFDAEAAGDTDAIVHWKIYDRPGGGYDHYEVTIRDGRCDVSSRPREEPDVTFRVPPVDFLRLVAGDASGMKLALRRRLRVTGDLALARKVERWFEIPRA